MKTRKRIIKRTMIIAALSLMTVGLICMPQMRSYAGGIVSVNVANQGSWPNGTQFTFDLYKVGEYGHDANGLSIFVLDNDFADSGVAQTLADASNYEQGTSSDVDWSQKWLDSANTLAIYINGMGANKPEPLTETVYFAGNDTASFSFTVPENGLYLLAGRSTEVGDTLWTPQPMFASVLNGETTITFDNSLGVKMTSRKIVHKHNVVKLWTGDEDIKDLVRPDKIAVKIMYGTTDVETVILSSENGYKFDWTDKVHYESGDDASTPDDDVVVGLDFIYTDDNGNEVVKPIDLKEGDAGWSVVELRDENDIDDKDAKEDSSLLHFYVTSYLPREISDEEESLTITNTLEYKSLELTKNIDGYDADVQNVTFSFLVEGRKNAEDPEPIYTNNLGVTFSSDDDLSKTVTLDYIPGEVNDIRIIEEYSSNYEMDGEPQITFDEENNIWKVTVNNKHDGHGPKGGVVNKYEHGKEPVQEG